MKELPTTPYITTFSGKVISLVDPISPIDITLEDVAQGLARVLRFNGLTKYPYSVARHSVTVSRLVGSSPALQMAALLHDAAEAYIQDIISPIKRYMDTEAEDSYRQLEARFMEAIYYSLSPSLRLTGEMVEDVLKADDEAFRHEVRALALHPELYGIGDMPEWPVIPGIGREESTQASCYQFRTRFHEINALIGVPKTTIHPKTNIHPNV